jgi:hypothetical protein
MRGLSLTRKRGENIILHVDQGNGRDPMILGVITVQEIRRGNVRLRLACRPSIVIARYDDDVNFEQDDEDEKKDQ